MPLRRFVILAGLFACCLVVVGIAWASGGELYLWFPHRTGTSNPPPSHPGIILGFLVGSAAFTAWLRQFGLFMLYVLTAGIVLGSVIGFFSYHWVPGWPQHLLTVAMIAACAYASKQEEAYFE